MAYCGSEPTACSSFNGAGRHWFKIDQAGLLSGGMYAGVWAQKQMMTNNYTWSVTIPETLRGGAYLMRHELIALHVPFNPEFYPECAHLYVVGSGDETPGKEYLASIPGVWEKDGKSTVEWSPREWARTSLLTWSFALDPDLHLSVYEEPTSSRTNWTIPGPAVWRGSGQT